MILAVDIGNTNIKIGLFDDKGKLAKSFKMSTDVKRTSDEYVALLLPLLFRSWTILLQTLSTIVSGLSRLSSE